MVRYQFLDSLRGLAICGVVMTHVGQAVPGLAVALESFARFGLRGVQLFFIISALTLCLVTSRAHMNLGSFYIRRFFRIAPMFYVAAIFYPLFSLLTGDSFTRNEIYAVDVVTTLLFLHGFNPHGINNVVPGGWSIASEAIFYAIFPFIAFRMTTIKGRVVIVGIAFALAVANNSLPILIDDIFNDSWRNFLHFNFLTNFPSFAVGMLIFELVRRMDISRAPGAWGHVASAAVIVIAVVVACFSFRIPAAQLAFVTILGTLVFVAARFPSSILVNPFLSFIGEISFSIYLVHFAVLYVLEAFWPIGAPASIEFVTLYLATMTASSVVAWCTYRWIERPMIRLGHALSNRIRNKAAVAPAATEAALASSRAA